MSIQETSVYNIFEFIDSNREPARSHIDALKKAFEEVGNLTKIQPILVNEKYEIIDGQHRFWAAKELGLPIFYTVVDGLGINEARNMNILHRNWKVMDYAKSYAASGNEHYRRYLEILDKYDFNHSITLFYLTGVEQSLGMYKAFREGRFEITDETLGLQRLNRLTEVHATTHLGNHKPFASGLLRVMNSPNYSHKRMIHKLTLHSHYVQRLSSVEDNMRMLEEIYNYSSREGNKVRLY